MKKNIFNKLCALLFCFAFFSQGLFAQCNNNKDIELKTQSDIDNFSKTYGATCNRASGIIISGSDIKNLAGLKQLTYLSGPLQINNTGLTSLNGLEELLMGRIHGGSLYIQNNPSLTSLNGIKGDELKDVVINNNASLTSLAGLERLVKVRNLTVINNSSLNSLKGIDNLTSISSMEIKNNPALKSIIKFDKIKNGNRRIETDVVQTFPTYLRPRSIEYLEDFDLDIMSDEEARYSLKIGNDKKQVAVFGRDEPMLKGKKYETFDNIDNEKGILIGNFKPEEEIQILLDIWEDDGGNTWEYESSDDQVNEDPQGKGTPSTFSEVTNPKSVKFSFSIVQRLN